MERRAAGSGSWNNATFYVDSVSGNWVHRIGNGQAEKLEFRRRARFFKNLIGGRRGFFFREGNEEESEDGSRQARGD